VHPAAPGTGGATVSLVEWHVERIVPGYRCERRGEALVGSVRFEAMHEGPQGRVHGGIIAYFFDAILGRNNWECGHRGMTGRLLVRYRRPIPLFQEVRFEARIARRGRHWVLARGALADEAGTLASAEGLFVEGSREGAIPWEPRS
jgi:acyl-coenzyme A thioesterase PaaI-like protein